ncbi:MAG: efflux RND transporter periplasmic adaptor subunit [Victivallales bacterium]|nr:efflux RND transporter periplasmic adaptor subunit [Victivallales bacterium]
MFYKKTVLLYLILITLTVVNTAVCPVFAEIEGDNGQIWTCSMHPQIKRDKPGKCPICSMDLIPMEKTQQKMESNRGELKLSSYAEKLSEVQTSKVMRKKVAFMLNLTGKLDYDETVSAKIVAHFNGRVEKLFANYTGLFVEKGTHLAEVFGADVYVNQQEILIAKNAYRKAQRTDNPERKRSFLKTYSSVLNKMRVLGFTKNQINKIMKRGKIKDTVVVYAPINGTILKKNIVEGQYFKKGDPFFEISDLTQLWLDLDAYEMDLPFLRYGQKVVFTVDGLPGKEFEGEIVFIEPVLDDKTRTAKARVIVDNSKKLLKPEMFAEAKVYIQLGAGGKVLSESLKGKWISPMHPQIIKDRPGKCDICGMDLIPASKLDFYKGDSGGDELPLVIPASAPLITGDRAIVYVKMQPGTYMAREVTLGPKAGNYYIVEKGLKQGEEVVTKGSFSIDSELQIKTGNAGMMSLLNVDNKEQNNAETSKTAKRTVTAVSNFYFDLQKLLADDNFKAAEKNAKLFKDYILSLDETEKREFNKTAKVKIAEILKTVKGLDKTVEIKSFRKGFFSLTATLSPLLKGLPSITGRKTYCYECSMAFNNKGAYWYQDEKPVANPYFGNTMKKCGNLKQQ